MVELLITVLILACIFAVAWWALQSLALPPPFNMVLVVVVAIIAIVLLVRLLPAGRLW